MARWIDLRSDTVTRPTAAMRKAMAAAEVGDDVFGEDPTVNRLQERAAARMGKETALFVPSGIMANQLAVRVLTQPGDEVIIESQAHIFHYEAGAGGALSGVQFNCLPGDRGILDPQLVSDTIRTDEYYLPPTRLICLENTHNRGGGTVYPLDTIRAIAKVAKSRGVSLHLDGARIFNASVASGISPAEYAEPFDTVSFCLSKGLGAPVGSMICTNRERLPVLRRLRRMFGGGMRQAGILAAAGLYALDHHIDRLAEDHANAKKLAGTLAELPGIGINPAHVETNIVIFDISKTRFSPPQAVEALKKEGVLVVPFGKTLLRAVTHLDVPVKDIEQAVSVFKKIFLRVRQVGRIERRKPGSPSR
jgi:threonine aldolase